MSLLVVEIDQSLARHLDYAIKVWRRTLREELRALAPADLIAFGELMQQLSVNNTQPASTGNPVLSRAEHVVSDRPRPYLTRQDVARIADVSLATVDRWIRSGELASSKRGQTRRIKRTDLDAFLNGDD